MHIPRIEGVIFFMSKRHVVALSVAAAALASFVLPAQAGSVDTAQRETRTVASGAAVKTVKMLDDVFKPKRVSVAKGGKVKWVNKGGDAHTTTGKGWNKTVQPGQSYTKRFKKAGTFKYVCTFHDGMKGTVKVS